MNKTLIILSALLMFATVLLAQQADPQTTNQPTVNAQGVVVDTEEIVIDVKAMTPVSGIYKSKADTFMASGKYRFMLDDQTIEESSELLLNKWLKESK
jgi:hypothetical protein